MFLQKSCEKITKEHRELIQIKIKKRTPYYIISGRNFAKTESDQSEYCYRFCEVMAPAE